MKLSDLLQNYSGISETKSGILMTSGKCVYLYNNACCESVCHRVLIRADKLEILAERVDDLFVYRHSAEIYAFKNLKRILKIREIIILYEIQFESGGLYGVFAYENGVRLMDSHFTDGRISDLIDSLILGKSRAELSKSEEFKRLEEAIRTGEVSALNKIYVNGGNIDDLKRFDKPAQL